MPRRGRDAVSQPRVVERCNLRGPPAGTIKVGDMLPVLFGYFAGSVPFAFLLARRAGIDVRVSGSGNVGAANVLRTTGAPLGVAVMALDVSQGAATVWAAHAAAGTIDAMAAAGAAAIVGHVYPVW